MSAGVGIWARKHLYCFFKVPPCNWLGKAGLSDIELTYAYGSLLQVSRLRATSGSRCTSPGILQRMYRPVRFTTRVRAANNAKTAPSVDVERLGVIPFDDDRESLMDALAFTGPAPEVGSVTRGQHSKILSRLPLRL